MVFPVDSGPILDVSSFSIQAGDTCETLYARAEHYSLMQFYQMLNRIVESDRYPIDHSKWKGLARTRKQFEEFLTINTSDPAEEIQRKARAVQHSRLPGLRINVGGLEFIQSNAP